MSQDAMNMSNVSARRLLLASKAKYDLSSICQRTINQECALKNTSNHDTYTLKEISRGTRLILISKLRTPQLSFLKKVRTI